MTSTARLALAAAAGIAFATGAGFAANPQSGRTPPTSTELIKYLNAFGDVLERIRRDAVDVPDDRKLIEAAIKGMLETLHWNNSYYSADDFRRQQEAQRGAFGGLGVELRQKNGLVEVVTPLDGSPGARAGLQVGDVITHVNDKPLKGLSLPQAVAEVRGPVGSRAKLKVVRPSRSEPLEIEIVRETIKIQPVRTRADDDVGYIRISTFNEQTLALLRTGARELTEKIGRDRVKGFILDLRNCPGGLLNVAIATADEFLDKGEIVSERGRNPDSVKRHKAQPGDMSGGKPLVVLINGGTAGGAEIVVSALRDHRRAAVVGTRSSGILAAATIIPIKELAGAIRLTTARYATPAGRFIDGQGIEPDHVVAPSDQPDAAQPAGLPASPPSYVPTDATMDKQLQFALELLRRGSTPSDDDLKALAELDETIQRDAAAASSYRSRAVLYEKMGRRADAIADYRKALLLEPSDRAAAEGLQRLDAKPF